MLKEREQNKQEIKELRLNNAKLKRSNSQIPANSEGNISTSETELNTFPNFDTHSANNSIVRFSSSFLYF